MPEIPRWKVRAALHLLGVDPDKLGRFSEVSITHDSLNSDFYWASIVDTSEDPRLHLLAMLPEDGYTELVTVDRDELKYFTGPDLRPDGLAKYPQRNHGADREAEGRLMAMTLPGASLHNLIKSEPALRSAIAQEMDHICCCNPNVALCGLIVGGTGVAFGKPEHSPRLCQRCANLDADGKRCGEPMCPGPEKES